MNNNVLETNPMYNYLYSINAPADLRRLAVKDLPTVCAEVREYLIEVISKVGGHFGAGLGVVELAVVLHYSFNTPEDKLIWDVGHQAYPHKILTGRRDALFTIRKKGGLSGFLTRAESEYDVFGAGHASTSLSAALGIATARDYDKKRFKVAAVIGDGAMTGGMAYEAMNNIGLLKKNIIVVLNDNGMSIAPNVWAFSNFFSEVITKKSVRSIKGHIYDLTTKMDDLGDRIRKIAVRLEEGVKAVLTPGMLFEALGFQYYGPINGNDCIELVKMFRRVHDLKGPVLLHVTTQKGKGYAPAENDPKQNLHAVAPFDKITGVAVKKPDTAPPPPTFTKIFGEALVEICRENPKVVGITAAMPDGTGLDILQREFPDRFFDVGIAEQHAIAFAAGLATQDYIPVAAIYSTFLQRAYDQIIHDVALQKLHVVFVLDRAGLVGADGPTHHGAFDLSYLRIIPGMVVMAPMDESELRNMLFTAVNHHGGPIAIRYPRGNALGVPLQADFADIPIGKGETLRQGGNVAIVAIGAMTHYSMQAAELLADRGISAEVVNARFVKPLDTALLDGLCARFTTIVTVEDNVCIGGFGSAVLEHIGPRFPGVRVHIHGIPDRFIAHGTPEELYHELGLDAEGIAEFTLRAMNNE